MERASMLADAEGIERVRWSLACARADEGAGGGRDEGRPSRPRAFASLTDREAEVAIAAAGGATNREIAAALGLSERTVRNYLSSAFAKLGVTRRSRLAPLVADG